MTVKWIGTKEMLADGITKVLVGLALANLRDKLQLTKIGTLWGSVVILPMQVWLPVHRL